MGNLFSNIQTLLTICAGASLGASLRYGVYRLDARWFQNAFVTTMVINALGSLVIGVAFALLTHFNHPKLQLFLMPGLLASFTTFSTFSLETLTLLKHGMPIQAMVYVAGQVILGVSFCYIGVRIGNYLLPV